MTESFHYWPQPGAAIDDFNSRLFDHCQDNDVVDIAVSCSGQGLFLSLIGAEDSPWAPPLFLMPVVYAYSEDDLPDLENKVRAMEAGIRAQSTEDAPSIPLRTQIVPRSGSGAGAGNGNGGYVVIIVVIGADEEDAAPGEAPL